MSEMLGVRRKYKIRKFFSGKAALFLVLILLVFLTHGAWNMYQKDQEVLAKRNDALAELERLQDRETELELEIARLSSARGMEEELRERYMIAREGERVVVISTDEEMGELPGERGGIRGFWKKILSAVGFSE